MPNALDSLAQTRPDDIRHCLLAIMRYSRCMKLLSTLLPILLCLASASAMAQYGGSADIQKEKQMLAKLQSVQKCTEAAYRKMPKNPGMRKQYVDSTVQLGVATMKADSIDRKLKYKEALRYYRAALKVDPKNETARKWSDTIVAIYKSMGRPVPK